MKKQANGRSLFRLSQESVFANTKTMVQTNSIFFHFFVFSELVGKTSCPTLVTSGGRDCRLRLQLHPGPSKTKEHIVSM